MFNAEKLLGKILNESMGHHVSGKKKKNHRGGLADALTSGTGLMTIIGLGVGAYEILKDQKKTGIAAGVPSAPQQAGPAWAPPPLPTAESGVQPPPPPIPATPVLKQNPSGLLISGQELATRTIQVMIAAAHADGALDAAEEKNILDRLRSAELDSEEKIFLLDALQHPKSIQELTAGINDPKTAKTMYLLAATAIEVDTEAERSWLDQLGTQLGLSAELRRFLEEQA